MAELGCTAISIHVAMVRQSLEGPKVMKVPK